MILPDLLLSSRINQRWQYSGIDSPDLCIDKKHFLEYPYPVNYQYNSRGFRDAEWPASLQALQEAIWCVGDSFTVGVGQPFGHIWPQVLSRHLKTRTINVSMDGASNDWICRRAEQIQTEIAPKLMVVMWSYLHRRESVDIYLDDEKRRIHSSSLSLEQDLHHWLDLVSRLRICSNNIIESTIPDFYLREPLSHKLSLNDVINIWKIIKDISWPRCPDTLDELNSLPNYILEDLKNTHVSNTLIKSLSMPLDTNTPLTKYIDISNIINIIERLDWARDYHHFDILTSEWLVDQILQRIKTLDVSRNRVLSGSDYRSFHL